jgi:hypothetical protein
VRYRSGEGCRAVETIVRIEVVGHAVGLADQLLSTAQYWEAIHRAAPPRPGEG